MTTTFILFAFIYCISNALALPLETPLPDPAQEAAAREIFRELRCVVCQSESIADSNAQVASDMRREIRAQLSKGKSHDEIVTYFTTRYGDYVLMEPPLKKHTALLWFGPAILFMIAGILVIGYFRHGQLGNSSPLEGGGGAQRRRGALRKEFSPIAPTRPSATLPLKGEGIRGDDNGRVE